DSSLAAAGALQRTRHSIAEVAAMAHDKCVHESTRPDPLSTFETKVASVFALMKFDRGVLDFSISHFNTLSMRLKEHGFENPRYDVAHTLQALQNIRRNESLRPNYEQMLNQCNVLLVSYFSAAIGDVFKMAVASAIRSGARPSLLKEEIK